MSLDRRRFLTACGRVGLASTLFPGVLFSIAANAEDKRITSAMIDEAAVFSGVPVAADQKAAMLSILNANRKNFDDLRALNLPNSVPPSFVFDPLPPGQRPATPPAGTDLRRPLHISAAPAIAK